MRTQLKTLTLAAAAALTATAHAGDKEILDLFVKKGMVTPEERAKALQDSKAKDGASNLNEIFAKEDAVKRLTFSGRVQVQYEGASYEQGGVDHDSISDFILRRMYLGAKADMGDGLSGEIVYNFADSSQVSTGTTIAGAFDKAVFTAETGYGKFDIGYQKVQWGQEENTSSSKLPCVERSLVTRYWAESGGAATRRVGLGARHVGIHYSNKSILGEGGQGTFNYGASVVTADQGYRRQTNDLGYYGFASLEWKPWGLTAGVNLAQNDHPGGTALETEGFNPYLKWVNGNLTLLAEYIETSVAGKDPRGANYTGVYKTGEKLELVARFADLKTDGRQLRASDGLRNIQPKLNGADVNTAFDAAHSMYFGANYYLNGDNAKVQAGFERAWLEGAAGGLEGRADIFRVQVQILF